jgi:hypothetical protein
MLGISLMAEGLLASQEGFGCVYLIDWLVSCSVQEVL